MTETVTTETNAEGNLENTNEKVVTDSNAVDANGVTTDTDKTWEETVDYNNGVWESTDGYEEGTKVVESTVEDPEDVNVHAVGVPTLPSSGGTTTTETVKVNDQNVEVKTTVYKEVSTDETGKRVTTTTTVVTQPKKDAEGAYVIDETTGEVVMETVTTVDRDVLISSTGDSDKSDGEWDYTEIETGREVTVTAENEKIEIFNGDGTVKDKDGNVIEIIGEDAKMIPIQPDWDYSGTKQDLANNEYNHDRYLYAVKTGENKPEGADVAYVGWAEDSSINLKVVATNEDGTTLTDYSDVLQFVMSDVVEVEVDSEGNPVTEENPLEEGEVGSTEKTMTGPVFSGYCVDHSTGTASGHWYSIENLEDADYYNTDRTEENGYISDADHIRAIAKNGYWGTVGYEEGVTDKEGNPVPKLGSMEAIRANLKAAGESVTGMTDAQIDALTEGEAQAATQMAIWKYGNGYENAVLSYGGRERGTADEGEAERVEKMAKYLMGLYDKGEETDVITRDNFIKELDFVVGDKATGDNGEALTDNTDDDDTNDVYNVSLKFALVVTPGENDDLVVKVVDANNTVVTSAKIGGKDGLTPDEEGNYTLSGMKLAENSDIDFDLKLEGVQYLEQGVYIYSAVDGYENSQTFVGIAEGKKTVDVGASIDLTFNVEEGTMKATRSWRKTWNDKDDDNGGGGNNGDDDDDDDDVFGDDDDDDVFGDDDDDGVAGDDDDDDEGLVAGDEDENAADEEDDGIVAGEEDEIIAATADNNHIIGAAGGMFAALAGLFGLRKRKEN